MYVCKMNSLIKELHQKFCDELNEKWQLIVNQKDLLSESDDNMLIIELYNIIKESTGQGYHFRYLHHQEDVINNCVMNTALEKKLLALDDWNMVMKVLNMANNSGIKHLPETVKRYQQLHSRLMQDVFSKFLIAHVTTYGPFFPGKKPDEIMVSGITGNTVLDMVLIAIINEKSTSHDITIK